MSTTLPSYITWADADIYFGNRLHVTAWLGATQAEKTIALVEATQRIDRLRFSGYLVADDQALEFPRYYNAVEGADGTEVIPDNIKYACCELAFALLDGVDPDIAYENLTNTQYGYGSAKIHNSDQDTIPHLAAGIPSVTAWRYLQQYLAPAKSVRIRRVS
jgi:hypothetical protein